MSKTENASEWDCCPGDVACFTLGSPSLNIKTQTWRKQSHNPLQTQGPMQTFPSAISCCTDAQQRSVIPAVSIED